MIKVRLNLRKMVATATCLAVSSMMFSSCGQSAKEKKVDLNSEVKQCEVDLSRQDEGVVINGIKWATRNVDKPGTFATKPESTGMLYQWNCKVGWSATDPMINSDGGINWNIFNSEDANWKKSNDPSPVGWRVPTKEEIKALLDTDKVSNEWTSENDVNGRKFTDRTSGKSIFLPAAGYRNYDDGVLYGIGLAGNYGCNNFNYHSLFFDNASKCSTHDWNSSYALSIRPVAE